MSLDRYPEDRSYGKGVYRRRVQLDRDVDRILATLDDTHHSMWLTLETGDNRVVGIDAGFTRVPATTCPGAVVGLRALIGRPIAGASSNMRAIFPAPENCTHLVDLAAWALSHAARASALRVVDVCVPDERGSIWVEVRVDGVIAHRWLVADHRIVAPTSLRGLPLMRGFLAWARERFDGDDLELAIMLQRGVFVARGRRYVVDAAPPKPLAAAPAMLDACYSYARDRIDQAFDTVGYVRDFTTAIVAEAHPDLRGTRP